MNFLAHCLLSGENEKVRAGNFMGDFIKGKQYLEYEEDIQKGVLLHREIDYYSDNHSVFNESRARLVEKYRHYSGVIIDMFYDHFLAANFKDYSDLELKEFTTYSYSCVHRNFQVLPGRARHIFPHMSTHDWLYHYASFEGLGQALNGMARRTKFDSKMDEAIVNLKNDYQAFLEEFRRFFPDILSHCKKWLEEK